MINFQNKTNISEGVALSSASQIVEGGEYGFATMTIDGVRVSCEYIRRSRDSDTDKLILEEMK